MAEPGEHAAVALDRQYPPDLLHAVMHALADGGCAEDERGAAFAALDAVADWATDGRPLWIEA